jgi:hypothetical protein
MGDEGDGGKEGNCATLIVDLREGGEGIWQRPGQFIIPKSGRKNGLKKMNNKCVGEKYCFRQCRSERENNGKSGKSQLQKSKIKKKFIFI